MQFSNRRYLIAGLASTATLVLSGCGDKEARPSPTATLSNNENVHAAVQILIRAADSLASNVSEFDTENWRDVVPNVRAAASDVTNAVVGLRSALGYSDAN